jgi:hypothetical protein
MWPEGVAVFSMTWYECALTLPLWSLLAIIAPLISGMKEKEINEDLKFLYKCTIAMSHPAIHHGNGGVYQYR